MNKANRLNRKAFEPTIKKPTTQVQHHVQEQATRKSGIENLIKRVKDATGNDIRLSKTEAQEIIWEFGSLNTKILEMTDKIISLSDQLINEKQKKLDDTISIKYAGGSFGDDDDLNK